MDKVKKWVCYVLRPKDEKKRRSYVGVTNNLEHRLRQHNGEIKGGAKATQSDRPWVLCMVVDGFGEDKSSAMRFEWFCKIKHYQRAHGGIKSPVGDGLNPFHRRAALIKYAKEKCKKDGITFLYKDELFEKYCEAEKTNKDA
jgi:predicted GIY-YIG superfamily endonuclease